MKREEIVGKDTVKEQYFKDYSKRRRGKIHPDDFEGKKKARENKE